MTLHNQHHLRAEIVDDDAIALYNFDSHVLTMTLAEWNNINMAMEGVKNED